MGSRPAYRTSSHRAVEIGAIALWVAFAIPLLVRLVFFSPNYPLLFVVGIFTGLLVMDFLSGMVHWAADTWGTAKTPVLGPNFIQPFREHHQDEKAITHHDFIETNGNNCLLATPFLVAGWFMPEDLSNASGPYWFFAETVLTFISLWAFATNQIHKWAHMDNPSWAIRALHASGLILTPRHHSNHHSAPYACNYCITNGWMNTPLELIGFFPKLEWIVTKLTGMRPRVDDLGLPEGPALEPVLPPIPPLPPLPVAPEVK